MEFPFGSIFLPWTAVDDFFSPCFFFISHLVDSFVVVKDYASLSLNAS